MRKWIVLGAGLVALWLALFLRGAPTTPEPAPDSVEPAAAGEALPTGASKPSSQAQPESLEQAAARDEAAPVPMPASGHFDAAQRAFEAESRDAAWAREQEALIPKLLAEVGFPRDAHVGEATCRRTLCRFQLLLGNTEADQFALMKLGAKLQTSQGLGLAYGAAELVDGKSRVVVYAPREGSSPESLEARP